MLFSGLYPHVIHKLLGRGERVPSDDRAKGALAAVALREGRSKLAR